MLLYYCLHKIILITICFRYFAQNAQKTYMENIIFVNKGMALATGMSWQTMHQSLIYHETGINVFN